VLTDDYLSLAPATKRVLLAGLTTSATGQTWTDA